MSIGPGSTSPTLGRKLAQPRTSLEILEETPRSRPAISSAAVPADRMGPGRRCLAARDLGGVSGRQRSGARQPDCKQRQCSGRSSSGCARTRNESQSPVGDVQSLAATVAKAKHPPYEFAVVDEAQDIGVAAIGFLRGAGGADRPERALLRRRPRPAHLSAAIFMEGAGRRHPRSVAHAERQLPHLPPNPPRPTACWGRVSDGDGNTEDRGETISRLEDVPHRPA